MMHTLAVINPTCKTKAEDIESCLKRKIVKPPEFLEIVRKRDGNLIAYETIKGAVSRLSLELFLLKVRYIYQLKFEVSVLNEKGEVLSVL